MMQKDPNIPNSDEGQEKPRTPAALAGKDKATPITKEFIKEFSERKYPAINGAGDTSLGNLYDSLNSTINMAVDELTVIGDERAKEKMKKGTLPEQIMLAELTKEYSQTLKDLSGARGPSLYNKAQREGFSIEGLYGSIREMRKVFEASKLSEREKAALNVLESTCETYLRIGVKDPMEKKK